MMPSQKFGVEIPNSAMPFATQSTGVSRRTAERMPAGTPITHGDQEGHRRRAGR